MPANSLIGIVDDDTDIPVAISSLVRSLGYEAECFHSAEQLLHRSNLKDFFCIISDIHMPSMDGIELTNALGDLERDLPVILMTGRMEPALAKKAYESSAISVVAKPFSVEDLSDNLRKAGSHRRGDA
ncbi:response regulator [Rhizobium bangladeshense]|uniref:response regulator n=1 Tax=Rhizobium bangladeshense TaxID=1138189 RepID=UPI001C834176|nr:response regulator [Rhizobium bangladeshense]MBX4871053.1 response regulator [Rhizobium bangladeshense]MBX4871353.1 response regulator [Rhizobium bangladeshense]MBX4887617.1 response regulator [Rhizobium bangladeshense]